VAFQRK
jgi:hypothetical protein